MYRFNDNELKALQFLAEFKYKPCIGSIFSIYFTLFKELYLNTTHVSVQSGVLSHSHRVKFHLNTTHVSVQFGQKRIRRDIFLFKYNPCIGSICHKIRNIRHILQFKYNPCIGSIICCTGRPFSRAI